METGMSTAGKWAMGAGLGCIVLFCGMCGFFGLIGSLAPVPPPTATTAPTAPSPVPRATVTPAPTPAPVARTPKLGESFELGNFGYIVKSVKYRRSVGNEYFRETASDGATFVVVGYTISNLANETKTVMTDDLLLRDARGREYRASSAASTAMALSGTGGDLILTEVQPGLQRKMSTVFEVPDSSVADSWRLVVPEKGWTGTGEVELHFAAKQ